MTTHQAAHVAVLEAFACDALDPELREALTAAIELMKQAGEPVAKLTTYEDTRAITARIHDVAHSLPPGTYDLYAAAALELLRANVRMDEFCDPRAKIKVAALTAAIELMKSSGWIPVSERLPDGVRGKSYQQWATDPVLVIHSDRPDYPIVAHAFVGDIECMGLGIRLPTNGASPHSGISWYSVGRDLQNPFGLHDQDYTRFSPNRFGRCITHWQPLPATPEASR